MWITLQVLPEIYGNYAIFLLSVDLPSNQISEIPENMFHALPNLAEFDCSNNFIEVLPDTISACKKLYSLSLGENNLSDLPESLLECKELFRIDINSNLMDTLPPVITKMVNLQRIYANNMYMTSLPEDIGNLVNLDKLYLNGNCFTSLPKSFANLRSLNDLGLCGVPWLHISKSKKVMSYENFLEKLRIWRLDRWLEAHQQVRHVVIFKWRTLLFLANCKYILNGFISRQSTENLNYKNLSSQCSGNFHSLTSICFVFYECINEVQLKVKTNW